MGKDCGARPWSQQAHKAPTEGVAKGHTEGVAEDNTKRVAREPTERVTGEPTQRTTELSTELSTEKSTGETPKFSSERSLPRSGLCDHYGVKMLRDSVQRGFPRVRARQLTPSMYVHLREAYMIDITNDIPSTPDAIGVKSATTKWSPQVLYANHSHHARSGRSHHCPKSR